MSYARKATAILAALALILTLGACDFYLTGYSLGALHTDSSLSYSSIGGFPTGGLSLGSYYSIPAGDHEVYYVAKYGSLYYPGNFLGTGSSTYTTAYVYHYSYTAYGTGSNFDLYLNHTGMGYSGDTTVVMKALGGDQSLLGTQEYEAGGTKIVIKGEILELSPEALAALPVSLVEGN